MAISNLVPYSPPADLISLKDASALFAETGYSVDSRTLKDLAVENGFTVMKSGRDNLASWSDLLEVHALEVDRRLSR